MNAKPKLPSISAVASSLQWSKRTIRDDYRAEGCEEDTSPSIQVTLGASGVHRDEWAIQTGDNSYTGAAYGYRYWGVGVLQRRSNCRALARDLIEQIVDQLYQ